MKNLLKGLLKRNFHLLESNKIDELTDLIYDFYIENNILKKGDNNFYYGDNKNNFDIHTPQDTKECIRVDVENGIYEERYEDDEPILIRYSLNSMNSAIFSTLSQYHCDI